MARSMHENDFDAQGAQHRKVQQNVGKIVRSDHLSVDGNHKHTLSETGNVLEDFAQVGNVHFDDGRCRNSNSSCALKAKVVIEFRRNDRGHYGRHLQCRQNPAVRHGYEPRALQLP